MPFVSTTHYSLLAALKHWNIDPKWVQILNLRPPEIVAAWERGDIDAAYVWDPALGKAKESGKVLVTSAEVAEWGAPTFDAWIVRTDFADAHPDVVTDFVQVTGDTYDDLRREGRGLDGEFARGSGRSQSSPAPRPRTCRRCSRLPVPALAEQT